MTDALEMNGNANEQISPRNVDLGLQGLVKFPVGFHTDLLSLIYAKETKLHSFLVLFLLGLSFTFIVPRRSDASMHVVMWHSRVLVSQ